MDLYWLDLETTGLNENYDKILEIALYKSSLEDPFNISFVYERVLQFSGTEVNMDDFVKNMHTKNGLLEECLRSNVSVNEIQSHLLDVIPDIKDHSNKSVLAGSAVHFDAGFLKTNMPTLYSRFSHRYYDISSIKLFCQSLGMPKMRKAEAHRAKDDILESVSHAKECAEWLKINLK